MLQTIDMCSSDIQTRHVPFILNPADVWNSFDSTLKTLIQEEEGWEEIKFLADDGSLNDEIGKIPNDYGGIYIFIAKPNIIPQAHQYIFYIGRAKCTDAQNLRKRCREYFLRRSRSKINSMITTWGKFLYIKYLPLIDNDIITRLESELILAIFPPFNDDYPNKQIKQAKKAAFL